MRLLKSVSVVAVLLFFVGCGNQAIYNVSNQPVPVITKEKTSEQVKKAIYAACLGRGWKAQDVSPGVISATLMLRTHVADVEIKYDSKKYSITYKSSTGLDSDGVNIHKNYNSWVRSLDLDIQKNLALQ
jgi:uncharacterized lipoprotein NlpE involved in copper resistance